MKNFLKAFKALGLSKAIRPILQYGLVHNHKIVITNLEVSIEIKNFIDGIDPNIETLVHIPTIEKCVKLGFKNFTLKDDQIFDGLDGVSVDMPNDQNIDDFPEMQFEVCTETTKEICLHTDELQFVGKTVATEKSRYALTGIAIYDNGTIASTDGRRLHISGDIHKENNTPKIIPFSIVALSKIYNFDGKNAWIRSEDDRSLIISHHLRISLRNIAGRFPDVKNVIPKKQQQNKIKTSVLMPILKKIKKVFGVNSNSIHFTDRASCNGVNFPITGLKDLDHRYNSLYLFEALQAIKTDIFSMGDKYTPIKIQEGQRMAIITPINLKT